MDWAHIVAYVTGTVDQELMARNEYPATENRILKDQPKGRLMLSDAERATLGEIGHLLGRKVLAESGCRSARTSGCRCESLLPPDDELVLVSGCHPIRAKKTWYYQDRRLTERVMAPPKPTTRTAKHVGRSDDLERLATTQLYD
jgi:hypothetical protein